MRVSSTAGCVLAAVMFVLVGCGGGSGTDLTGSDVVDDLGGFNPGPDVEDTSDLVEGMPTDTSATDIVSDPCIKVTPSPVDFGGKLIGQTAGIDVEIKSCGTAPLEITDIFLQDGKDGTFQSNPNFQIDYAKLPAGVKPTVEKPMFVDAGVSVVFTVQFTPGQQNPVDPTTGEVLKDRGVIQIDNNTLDAKLEIETLCFGVWLECPQAIIVSEEGEEVMLPTTIHLHGDQSQPSVGSITSYHWTVDGPEENKSDFEPSPDVPNPTYVVNVGGTYTFCLDVCDAQSCSSDPECNTTVCKKVAGCPCSNDIHCELYWDTPNDANQFDEGPDAGTDMDFHFAHPYATGPDIDEDGNPDPWFDLTYDCFWYNPNPNWDDPDPNVPDDPSLDRNDTDGAGPENIYLKMPVDGRTYRIGVHYMDDHGYGSSYPTVKCWIAGQTVYEKNLKELGVPMNTCDMWDVATIDWPSGQVKSVLDASGGPKITHCYQNPAFVWGDDPCGCVDGDLCTQDICDPLTGCSNPPWPWKNCECSGDPKCDPATGVMTFKCSECEWEVTDPITGSCNIVEKNCTDEDPSTTDSCDPVTGECRHLKPGCADSNPCTEDFEDTTFGQCFHYPKDCDDDDPCTTDTCIPQYGDGDPCQHTPIPDCQ